MKLKILLTILFLSFSVIAQTKERRIVFNEYTCNQPRSESKDDDSNCLVELKEIFIGSEKIVSGKTFTADENWLKNLKIKIKNVSGKPFIAVAVSFGLIEGLNEKLAPSASWGWVFSLFRGKFSDPNDKKRKISKVVVLKQNEETELTFSDFPSSGVYNVYRSAKFEQVIRNWQQIVMKTAFVELKNGTQKDSFLFMKENEK